MPEQNNNKDNKPIQEPAAKPKKELVPQLKAQVQKYSRAASRFQTTIIALVVVGLLALTTLRMLRYMDPPIDNSQVQANLSKSKQIHINQKDVQKIKQLQDSGTSARPDLEGGRTNPFSE